MGMTRNEALKVWLPVIQMGVETMPECKEALDMAISSLKTDEAYQIMYEGGEIFTKDDMVAVLEDLKKKMNIIKEAEYQIYGKEHWNFVGKCQDVIQEKINALKGDSND